MLPRGVIATIVLPQSGGNRHRPGCNGANRPERALLRNVMR